jgi:hypothetical protein
MLIMKTLDERINDDIIERLNGKPISEAKKLSPAIRMNSCEATEGFSILGLPGYFCGNRDADTVVVNLNPGMDAHLADCMWTCRTLSFNHSSPALFIKDFKEYSKSYGIVDKARYDSFDIKQAAFFYKWIDSGIGLPQKPQSSGWEDKDFCLKAKEAVLMNRLQLELVPYASAKFTIDKSGKKLFFPFVETLLHEIFQKERTYVIFASAIFEDIFKAYNRYVPDSFDLSRKEQTIRLSKKNGQSMKSVLKCKQITLKYNGKEQKALIAHSFPSQSIGRAFDIMQDYGEFCYNEYIK